MATASTDPRVWTPRLWGALFVLCGALFLDGLDVSMIGVALPSIGADLHLSTSALQWVLSGYVLGYGGLLLLGGRSADLLGRRRVFLIAVAAFAAASLLSGVVDNGALLIASRFVKGTAAAFTAPAGLSIITTTFPEGPARNRALSIYTLFGASGFSSGLILGGLMTQIGWHWALLLPVPVALAVLLAGIPLIPRADHSARQRGHYDLAGAALSTVASLLLVYTVVEASTVGWASARTIGSLVLVAVLAVGFVTVERRTRQPLVRLGILRSGSLVRANLGMMAMFGSYFSFQFIGTLYMQSLLGWSPLTMALAFLPTGLLVALSAPWAGTLVGRLGAPRLIALGFVALTAGYLLFLRVQITPHYAVAILPTIVLIGIGFALAFSALNIQATSGIVDEEQGLASGLVQTSGQLGGAIVLAAVTAVVTAHSQHGPVSAAQTLASFRPGLVLVSLIGGLGLLVALTGLRRPAPADAPEALVEVEEPVLVGID
ncbi:MFS transporter [Rugosimonospora africana]|uniref:MFS transporter n=1 Tax=Rugosimonospora africana TaxID=556532 RepID=A0A8J3QLA8_9ACTN|nr:MFS transporter [Rugosimonospora africana]GIH13053.1 MFS transporter [Rugosimonospora africana]